MRSEKVDGYLVIYGPYGEIYEMDTLKCNHCQGIIKVGKIDGSEPDEYGWCYGCSGYVCKECYGKVLKKGCQHFMKEIEKAEEADYVRRTRGY